MRLHKLVGDRAFYRQLWTIVLPIIIQNTITNVVSLLDNIMVGSVGTLQMSAVAIINQLIFIFALCIFGGHAGASIFATQYAGANDHDGVRYCFRIKMFISVFMICAAIAVFTILPNQLISVFLTGGKNAAEIAETLGYARGYLTVMLVGLIPFAVTQAYAGTLRDTGETRLPMLASVVAIFVNLCFNYLLIFGKLGFPCLGVVGAGVATSLSRFVEAGIIVTYTHIKSRRFPFIKGAYSGFRIPLALCSSISRKGLPLLINEFFWSSGMTMLMQCYSVRGLDVVAATNIASTIGNVFNVVFLSMGNAVAVILGQELGANKLDNAKTTAYRLLATNVSVTFVIGAIMLVLSPAIPQIYNTSEEVRSLACSFLRILACIMPLHAFNHCCYFTLRSGGRTFITFLFDSLFVWMGSVSCAYFLAYCTDMPIVPLYLIVQCMELIKVFIGWILVSKGIWIRNIITAEEMV